MRKPSPNQRFAAVSCAVMAVAAAFIVRIFYRLYDASRQNIMGQFHGDVVQAANQINYYMKMPVDAVSFAAVTINEMTQQGRSHEEVGAYLVRETAIYASIISENNTGVYSYYRGEYLDGSGWIPPEDYEPTARPWYAEAVRAGGEVAFVKPFLNLQTMTMMMSVSKLLDDGESVVSMDIFLDSVQQMSGDMAVADAVEAAIVMDGDGFVVAHSDSSLVGKNLGAEGGAFGRELAARLAQAADGRAALRWGGRRYAVFAEPIRDGWQAVFVLDEGRMYRSLTSIYVASGAALVLVMGMILAAFLYMSRTYGETVRLSGEVRAVADIYVTVVKVDLRSGAISCIRGNPDLDALLGGDFTDFCGRAAGFAERVSAEPSRELLKTFMDTGTLGERLREAQSITHEFMDDKERWIRMRFIVVDRDEGGAPRHVLWAFESIDEDRRQQEHLRRLSETDLMTGIRNRGHGELLTRRATLENRAGMFCLMDVDSFKSINDTYGHAAGDKVIIAIADCLKKAFRDTDIVFRLGGDEFAAFADGVTTEDVGRRVIQRFFDRVAALDIPELGDRKITLSMGATFYPVDGDDSFETMYQRADEGTYESKRASGSQAVFRLR